MNYATNRWSFCGRPGCNQSKRNKKPHKQMLAAGHQMSEARIKLHKLAYLTLTIDHFRLTGKHSLI